MSQKDFPYPAADVFNGGRGTSFNDNWKFHLGDLNGPATDCIMIPAGEH